MRRFAFVAGMVGAAMAATAMHEKSTNVPSICSIYFNFTGTNVSNMYYGRVGKDGMLDMLSNWGARFDPQGQVFLSDDGTRVSIATLDNGTIDEKFGCCDPTSLLTANVETGKWNVASFHRKNTGSPVQGVECGKYGCGFLAVGGLEGNQAVAWVEDLLPPPPPSSKPVTKPVRGGDYEGLAFASFDAVSGTSKKIRPFSINTDNQTAPGYSDRGMVSFHDGGMYFKCQPQQGNFNLEGVCSTLTTMQAPVQVIPWNQKTYTITDMAYSAALKASVVIGQSMLGTDAATPTKVFLADDKKSDWPVIVDLGIASSDLHQTTISADGRYLFVLLRKDSGNPNLPNYDYVVVDLVRKREQSRTALKQVDVMTPLVAVPC